MIPVHRIFLAAAAASSLGVVGLVACSDTIVGPDAQRGFEVWVMDQSPTTGKAYGGLIHIFHDTTLAGGKHTLAATTEVVDLSGPTTALCQSNTGAVPVQAHNIMFNATRTHAIVAFLASGHVAILNAATRQPVACLQMSIGASGMRHAHQAVAAPDGSYILVANQMGKLIERIDANFATNTFALNTAATINLASCQTPSGVPCESAALRPNNQPVTFSIDATGNLAFVTMRGGGFFAINPRVTPMQIRAEYDAGTIGAQGLASIRVGGDLFTTSGANSFRLYRFSLAGFSSSTTSAPNQPAPTALVSDGTSGRDGHGMTVSKNERYVWVTDRGGNVIEVFDVSTGTRANTLNMVGALSPDPSPDLLATAPEGDLVFVTFKGPNPLSGVPWGTGSTPGLGIIAVGDEGRSGQLLELRALTNKDAGGIERADPHGLAIRPR